MTDKTPSLRARKRQATFAAIEDHATRLVLEHGLNDVTVEQICEAANISRRTFFNYVDTKESAVLGKLPAAPSAQEREDFLAYAHGTLLLRDVVNLLLTITLPNLLRDGGEEPRDPALARTLIQRRKAIQSSHPELKYARSLHGHAACEAVVELVTEHLTRHPSDRSLEGPVSEEARTLFSVAHAAVMLSVNAWLTSSSSDPATLRRQAHHALRDIYSLKGMVE